MFSLVGQISSGLLQEIVLSQVGTIPVYRAELLPRAENPEPCPGLVIAAELPIRSRREVASEASAKLVLMWSPLLRGHRSRPSGDSLTPAECPALQLQHGQP